VAVKAAADSNSRSAAAEVVVAVDRSTITIVSCLSNFFGCIILPVFIF
jgi:acetolactate synthase regulatory subunit